MGMLQHALSYHHDSALLFERIKNDDWAMLLDSGQLLNPHTGQAGSQYGRYDILVAQPFLTVVTTGQKTTITQQGVATESEADPFAIVNQLLRQYPANKTQYPFAGGALGYFAYDLGRSIEKLPDLAATAANIPEMMLGFYDWAIVVDHREKRSMLVSHGLTAGIRDNWQALCAKFDCPVSISADITTFTVLSETQSNLSESQYYQAFAKVKNYISAGDCYQVNLAQRFAAKVQGDGWQAYKKLRQISPAPFMAYMNLPLNATQNVQVLSNSPERFLQTDGNHVETRPIKGTRPRSADPVQDLAYSSELLTSLKDRAENVMIVDLTGKLKKTATAIDLLKGCFPGGSITGAPKLRAMQIIEELEPHKRGLYCGAIGYIGFDGKMDTNIAIRTAVFFENELSFYAGGGIVADSVADKEYNETLDKASNLKALLEYYLLIR